MLYAITKCDWVRMGQIIPLNAFLLDALMDKVKPGPCNAVARVLMIPCCRCHCGDNARATYYKIGS